MALIFVPPDECAGLPMCLHGVTAVSSPEVNAPSTAEWAHSSAQETGAGQAPGLPVSSTLVGQESTPIQSHSWCSCPVLRLGED